MKLVDNWRAITRRSSSFWFSVASAFFGALELAVPLFKGHIPPLMFAGISTACATLAAVSRVIHQASLHVEKQ